jgi:hypothetical protein
MIGGVQTGGPPPGDTPTITNPQGTPGTETVVIFGLSKAMAAQGVTNNLLDDPVMEVHTTIDGNDTILASDDDWDGAPPTLGPGGVALHAKVRAVTWSDCDAIGQARLASGSKEAGAVVTIPNGTAFTIEVHGKLIKIVDGVGVYAEGNCIFEVYEADQLPE